MNRSLLAAILAAPLLGASVAAASDVFGYDGFSNWPRQDLNGSNGGMGWTGPWVGGGSLPIRLMDGGLTYAGLGGSRGVAVVADGGLPDQADYWRPFDPSGAVDNRMYVSFLMRPEQNYGSWSGIAFGYYPTGVYIGNPMGMYQYGMMYGHGLFALTNVPVIEGQTALCVVEIHVVPGGKIEYKLYVDPPLPGGQPPFPGAQITIGGSVLPSLIRISSEGGYSLDELRIGATWASVTPVSVCSADCDGSGALDVDDFICFQTLFGLGDAAADCDQSGSLDIDDFICFQTAFGVGCP